LGADFSARFGGGICNAAAGILDEILTEGSALRSENFKFISEAIIATARIESPPARTLNFWLGDALLSPEMRAVLMRNPRSAVMYALPVTFLHDLPPRGARLLAMFDAVYGAGAARALHHPQYRNLELEYVASRAGGVRFFHDPFDGIAASLPWMDRDQIYSLTHVHFYNSDFGVRQVSYHSPALGILEALIARMAFGGDVDVLLELLICYASTSGASADRLAFHDQLCLNAIETLCGEDGAMPPPAVFREHYHPIFVASLYLSVRGKAFAPGGTPAIERRHASLGALLGRVQHCDLLMFLSDYALHCRDHGVEEAIEPSLALQAAMVAVAIEDREAVLAG